jgi:sensor histidine kinase regulating citrate/malate metabolism
VYILDRFISLFIKHIIFIIPIIIVSFVVVYNVAFSFMLNRLNNEIFNELLLIGMISAKNISGDDIESLKSIKDHNNSAYQRLLLEVKEIIGDNRDPWNKLYYTAVYKIVNDTEYFLFMSNDETNMFRPYGRVDEDAQDYELFTKGKSFASIDRDADGTWAISNIPIRNSAGKIIGIFEIGFDMTHYETMNMQIGKRIAVIVALICLLILIVLFVIISFVVKELSSVVHVLGSIASGDYSVRVKYRARD